MAASSSPALAQHMMSGSVVEIHGCAAQRATSVQQYTDFFGSHVSQSGAGPMLMIDFENSGNKQLQWVEFAYLQNGKVDAVVRDSGMFAPKAAIMHAFSVGNAAGFNPDAPMSCVPLRALYADGTMWTNPDAPKK